ncbi:MAG: GGDEF domain-containing protein [Spirochaetes bacterium]|nr:GGDEF domain-containing protein [Spirochaetota bacterium]MBU1080582.1 GGDEF domain-containing protein [Spirochaetota bacterium]
MERPSLMPARRAAPLFLVLGVVAALSACSPGRHGLRVRDGEATAPAPGVAARLDGDWLFTPGGSSSPVALGVPRVWNSIQPGLSSGEYRLRLAGLAPGRLYALRFMGISSAGIVSVDGRAIGDWGLPETTYAPRTYRFVPSGETVSLAVAVENTEHATGGLWMPVWFGEADAVERSSFLGRFVDIMITGSIVMMALYHLALFAMRREERSTLYFALFCLVTVVKTGLSDQQLLATLVPALDGAAGLRTAYVATILLPITFLAYLYAMFPRHRNPAAMGGLVALGTAQAVFSVVAPVRFVQSWFLPYQAAILLAAAYVMAVLARELRERSPGARLMLAGVLILIASTVNDILHDLKIIYTFYSIGLGLFAFLFSQSLVLGRRFALSFKEVKDLNANLERRVAERTGELERLSRMDSLTGLINRRHFWELLEREWDRWTRYGHGFCLALVDIDRFKDLNDSLGHAAGDEALKSIGGILQESVRKTDTVSRYGGEEFCIILPGTEAREAASLLEKIRVSVEAASLAAGPARAGKTISYGIAKASGHSSPAELVNAADMQMYRAKSAGRNRGFVEA